MKNTKKIVLVVVFLLLIVLPGFPLLPTAEWNAWEENRLAAEKPVLGFETLREYPAAFEAYYNDAFPLRSQLLDAYGALKWSVGDVASERVVRGKDGWLFYHETLADYKGNEPWSADELAAVAEYLVGAQQLAEAYGAQLYVFWGPNKNDIYPDYMPARIRRSETYDSLRSLERFILEETTVNYIPLRDVLQGARAEYPELYYPQGTHWNTRAAYLAYCEVYTRIQADFPGIRVLRPDQLVEIDSRYYIGANASAKAKRSWGDYTYTLPTEWAAGEGWVTELSAWSNTKDDQIRHFADAGNGLKVLVLHDSFWENMMDFSAGSADETIIYNTLHLTQEMMEAEQPDIVILEVVQRGIYLAAMESYWLNLQKGE